MALFSVMEFGVLKSHGYRMLWLVDVSTGVMVETTDWLLNSSHLASPLLEVYHRLNYKKERKIDFS